MKKLVTIPFIILFVFTLKAQEWNWTVGNGGNNGRYSQAQCVLGPLSEANVLWESGAAYSFWPHQIHTKGDTLVTDRTFNISNTLEGTSIVAYNILTGTEFWAVSLPVDFPDTDWRNRVCGISDVFVFATRSGNTNYSYLYALDINNGSIVWQSEGLVDMSSTEGVVYAENGDLIVGNFQTISRIDVTDGSTIWQTDRSSPTSGGSEVAIYQDHIYGWAASTSGPKISVFDINTGGFLYESRGIAGGLVQQIAPLAGPNGMVYAPRAANNVLTDTLVAFQDTGSELKELWKLEMGWVPSGTHGVGPDGSFYMYSRNFEIYRIAPDKSIAASHDIAYKKPQTFTNFNFNNLAESVSVKEPGYVKVNHFECSIDSTVIPADTSIYIADPNAVFNSPRMAIDTDGYIYLSNGYNSVFCFDDELNLIWNDNITDVGGPALAKNGNLAFPAEGTVIKVYEGNGLGCTTYSVTFLVHNQFGELLQGAAVFTGNEMKITDENGEAVFYFVEGEISYTASYSEYEISGNYTVTAEPNQIVDVEFMLTSIFENGEDVVKIYPNPTSGIILVESKFQNIENITISDITGKTMINRTDVQQQETIDMSHFENGIYLIRIQTKNEIFTERIIKN